MKQPYSNINLNFDPMEIPEIEGRFGLESLLPNVFPLLVTTFKTGVDIIIREGHVFTMKYPYTVLNTQFRERFKGLLRLTKENNFTVHGVVYHDNLSALSMDNIINSDKQLLPENTKIQTYLSLYEVASDHTPLENMIRINESIFGKRETPFLPNVLPANYTAVKSKEKLTELVDIILTSLNDEKGKVLLVEKEGKYIQGKVNLKDTGIVIVYPVEEVWGVIAKVKTKTVFLPGETLRIAEEVLIKFGGTELIYKFSNSSLLLRGFFAEKSSDLVGSKVLCKNLFLPGHDKPIIKRIVKINY